jgi:hypothetical protein
MVLPAIPLVGWAAIAGGTAAAAGATDLLTPGGNVTLPGIGRDTTGLVPKVADTADGPAWRWFDPKTGNYLQMLPHERSTFAERATGAKNAPLPDLAARADRKQEANYRKQLLGRMERQDQRADRAEARQDTILQNQLEVQQGQLQLGRDQMAQTERMEGERMRVMTAEADKNRTQQMAFHADSLGMANALNAYRAGIDAATVEADVNVARTNTELQVAQLRENQQVNRSRAVQGYLQGAMQALANLG